MTATDRDDGLELRSAHFPETVLVRPVGGFSFDLRASNELLLDEPDQTGLIQVHGYGALYAALKSAAGRVRTMPNRVADAFRIEIADIKRTVPPDLCEPLPKAARRLPISHSSLDLKRVGAENDRKVTSSACHAAPGPIFTDR